jgi:hypothetical protein
MKKYMVFDAFGILKTRLLENLHNIPATAVLVDDELWSRSIQEVDGLWTINGQGLISKQPLPPPTERDLITILLAKRDQKLRDATLRIAPLQDAMDLDEATMEEETALNAWKRYRIALNRVEQQPGFPHEISWPMAPIKQPKPHQGAVVEALA